MKRIFRCYLLVFAFASFSFSSEKIEESVVSNKVPVCSGTATIALYTGLTSIPGFANQFNSDTFIYLGPEVTSPGIAASTVTIEVTNIGPNTCIQTYKSGVAIGTPLTSSKFFTFTHTIPDCTTIATNLFSLTFQLTSGCLQEPGFVRIRLTNAGAGNTISTTKKELYIYLY